MAFSDEKLEAVFVKTDGRCHLCGKNLAWNNYGLPNRRGAWEVEHSRPKSKGGTDHLNNLYPACINCNRQKGVVASRTARGWHGRQKAPYSAEKKARIRQNNAINGAAIGALGFAAGPIGFVTTLLGAVVGNDWEIEE